MKKILIIEDDQVVASIYRNKFQVEGFAVEVAHDGQLGLDLLKNYRPDAIILDLVLPKVPGAELIRQIRSEPDLKDLPIIVFTNTYLTRMVEEAWKAGATKCLSKANSTPRQVIEAVCQTLAPPPCPPPTGPVPPPPPKFAPPPKPTGGEPLTPAESDAAFQAEVRNSFLEGLPATTANLRTLLQSVIKAESQATRLRQLQELHHQIHALAGNAGAAGALQAAQMADALEALLKELHEKPKNINPSTLRTVASAFDFLDLLLRRGVPAEREIIPPASILVVDDEPISRRAITHALEKANLKSVGVEDPQVAFQLLAENQFDLIFLDIDMPAMTGFELCAKLRNLPNHKKTPVVFVTSLNDFESRTNSTMSGGNDLIGKPFLFIELAVKALVYILRGRFDTAKPASVPSET